MERVVVFARDELDDVVAGLGGGEVAARFSQGVAELKWKAVDPVNRPLRSAGRDEAAHRPGFSKVGGEAGRGLESEVFLVLRLVVAAQCCGRSGRFGKSAIRLSANRV